MERTLRLINSTEVESDTRYTTLSYCWGKDASCTLRQHDIKEFRKSVLVDELPQTFQDVAAITWAIPSMLRGRQKTEEEIQHLLSRLRIDCEDGQDDGSRWDCRATQAYIKSS
jgi:hypothetical protein